MRPVLSVLLILLLFITRINAQLTKSDYYIKIDNNMFLYSKKHASVPLNFDSVAMFVNKTYLVTEDRVRAYYTWISININYDMEYMQEEINNAKLLGGHLFRSPTQRPDTVLTRKRAVCEGFSLLMNKFCKSSGIPSQMIIGYTKTPDGTTITDILHAWNAIKIDSAWGLLDITWSNGYVDQNNQYHKQFSYKYFLTRPPAFLRDHLPLDPMWQLLPEPITKNHFINNDTLGILPYAKGNYNDSISAFMQKSESDQRYLDLFHSHLYDPDNKGISRNLDVSVHNTAVDLLNIVEIEFDDYMQFYNTVLIKNPNAGNFKKARLMLERCKAGIREAKNSIKGKKAITQEFENSFSEIEASSDKNVQTINEHLENISRMQKMTGGGKGK